MIQFTDGPAADVVLDLRRTPILLRVVRGPGGNWDALDQLDDAAAPEEAIHVYRLAGEPTTGFIDYRGKGGRREGRAFVSARYEALPDPPGDADVRDNAAWRAWCEANKARLWPAWMQQQRQPPAAAGGGR